MAQVARDARWCKRGSPLTVRCDALNPRFQQDVVGCRLASKPAACGAPAALSASRPKRKRQRFQRELGSIRSGYVERLPRLHLSSIRAKTPLAPDAVATFQRPGAQSL